MKPESVNHSIWDLLHHTVIWNDIFIQNIKGYQVSWEPENEWPKAKDKLIDNNFYFLIKKFNEQLFNIQGLLKRKDLDFRIKNKVSDSSEIQLTTIKLFITILQHISYQ